MPVAARRLPLANDLDVADAARAARELAQACGLSAVEAQHVATAVSEVATNACKYGGGGQVELAPAEHEGRAGVLVSVSDAGPGIGDVAAALRDGVSSGGSLGLGLPAARRLMDAFAIDSGPGRGTVVRMSRWAGGATAGAAPVACRLVPGSGGEAIVQPYRNGVLLALRRARARPSSRACGGRAPGTRRCGSRTRAEAACTPASVSASRWPRSASSTAGSTGSPRARWPPRSCGTAA